jgi:hypothetical protein
MKYVLAVWNSITSTVAKKFELIQQQFASVCFYHLFPHVPYSYTFALEKLNLHSLSKRRHHLDETFFMVYRDLKSSTSLLENVSLRVPTCNVRNFVTISVYL